MGRQLGVARQREEVLQRQVGLVEGVGGISAPATFVVDVGAELLKAPVASIWKAAAADRISLIGGRSTTYRCVSWALSDSARDTLATPRKAPASAIRVSTTPSRTMARWGAYHRQGSRRLVFDPVLTVVRIGAFVTLHKLPSRPSRIRGRLGCSTPGSFGDRPQLGSLDMRAIASPRFVPVSATRLLQGPECLRGKCDIRPAARAEQCPWSSAGPPRDGTKRPLPKGVRSDAAIESHATLPPDGDSPSGVAVRRRARSLRSGGHAGCKRRDDVARRPGAAAIGRQRHDRRPAAIQLRQRRPDLWPGRRVLRLLQRDQRRSSL